MSVQRNKSKEQRCVCNAGVWFKYCEDTKETGHRSQGLFPFHGVSLNDYVTASGDV